MHHKRQTFSMSRMMMPTIQHELFLGQSGFMGLRCGCGYLVTGRTAESCEANINAHARYRHIDELLAREHCEPEDRLEP